MRILIVNDYGVLSGGAERVSLILREGLRKRGHEAALFTSCAKPVDEANPADYTCFGSESFLMRVFQAINPFAIRSLRAVLREYRPELIHVRMFKTQLSPFILPLCADFPCLYHVGSLQSICPLNTKLLPDHSICHFKVGAQCYRAGCVSSLGLARVALQHGAWNRWRGVFGAIVANSRWLAQRLRDDGVPVSHVIHNGTPPAPPRPALGQRPMVGFAGRLVPEKGIDTLLDAMVLVAQKIPDIHLILAGDGPIRSQIENQIRRLKLGSYVSMPGYLPPARLAQQLNEAWVQVVPSGYEDPFPNVIIEAMMRGTPVIATALGGATEIVRDGQTGFLIAPSDRGLLAEKLVGLLEDRGAAEKMGAAARELALAQFSEDEMLNRFLEVYSSLLLVPNRHVATTRGGT